MHSYGVMDMEHLSEKVRQENNNAHTDNCVELAKSYGE